MFIRTENTPNPNALKFLPGVIIAGDFPVHFTIIEDSKQRSNLAYKLLVIAEVEAVFLGYDFITITKSADIDWTILKPEILVIIMDHLTSGLPIFDYDQDKVDSKDALSAQEVSEIEQQIIEIIDTRIRPSVAMDGGDIIYRGFDSGVVMLELRGACSGCPSATITLKNGIETMLKHFIPEVQAVESIS